MDAGLSYLAELLVDFGNATIGPNSRLWPGYILIFVLMAYAVFRYEGCKRDFLKFLFPKEVYFTKSALTDVKLFLSIAFLQTVGLFNSVVSNSLVAVWVASFFVAPDTNHVEAHPLLVAAVFFVAADFNTYITHRWHHRFEPLWFFHAVHHSAEELNPISAFRIHPVETLIYQATRGILFGITEGLLLALFFGPLSLATLVGVNTLIFVYSALGSNLRHSHIWLSYGPYLSYLLISPAMHQIHHSTDPKHYDKNYGGALAIFDWIYGTLYIPKEKETLQFGLVNQRGERFQPHNGLAESWIVPFVHLSRWLKSKRKEKSPITLKQP